MAERKGNAHEEAREEERSLRARAHPGHVQQHDRDDHRLEWWRDRLGSAGLVGFKGSRKSTLYAAAQTADLAARKAMEHGVRRWRSSSRAPVRVEQANLLTRSRGPGGHQAITDVTPIPHNGCRPPKRRRIQPCRVIPIRSAGSAAAKGSSSS